MPHTQQVRLKIYGYVQGVLFRAGAREKALSLNISGWIKNESDGTVSIYAAGAPANIQTFIDWCKHGPEDASVEKMEIETGTAAAEEQGFEIRY